jgi:cell division protein FtsB
MQKIKKKFIVIITILSVLGIITQFFLNSYLASEEEIQIKIDEKEAERFGFLQVVTSLITEYLIEDKVSISEVIADTTTYQFSDLSAKDQLEIFQNRVDVLKTEINSLKREKEDISNKYQTLVFIQFLIFLSIPIITLFADLE